MGAVFDGVVLCQALCKSSGEEDGYVRKVKRGVQEDRSLERWAKNGWSG